MRSRVNIDENRPSATIEHYLRAIRELQEGDALPQPKAIAEAMAVSRATVTDTLRRLEAAGFIERVRTRVRLTDSGLRHAELVDRRRAIGAAFLEQCLGLPREVAEREACDLEHALSQQATAALESRLGLLTACVSSVEASSAATSDPHNARRAS